MHNPKLKIREDNKKYNLMISQQNLWNLQKYYENSSITNICGAIYYNEKLNTKILEKAINITLSCQSGFRLNFKVENGQIYQYITDYEYVAIPVLSFENKDQFDSFANKEAKKAIGLMNKKMYRFTIFEINGQTGILIIVSHLIGDAWALSLMAKRIDELYNDLISENNRILEPVDYTEYVVKENFYITSEQFKKDEIFWKKLYKNGFEPSLVKSYSESESTAKASKIKKYISKESKQRIENFCEQKGISPAVFFELVLLIYLSKVNRENREITLGILNINRNTLKEKNVIGTFMATLPLTICIREDMSLDEFMEAVLTRQREVFRHHRFPYTNIVEDIRKRENKITRMFDVMFSFQNAKTESNAQTEWFSNGYSEVPLAVHIDDRDNNGIYTITLDYQIDLFKKEEIDLLYDRLIWVIEQLLDSQIRDLDSISILPECEKNKILYDFNGTQIKYDQNNTYNTLIYERVSKSPEKTAVIFNGFKMDYNCLNRMSNSLAHYLRNRGITKNDIVPIMCDRTWKLYVAMLGIIKSGGAFMNIDSKYPEDRIEYMLDLSNAKYMIGQGAYRGQICHFIDIDNFDFNYNESDIEDINDPEDLCYVIFTSGSTGNPKGLTICHKNIVNFCNINHLNINDKVIDGNEHLFLSVTNPTFDMFITESLLPMANGITVLLADEEQIVNQKKLSELCDLYRPDIIETTPTKMKMYISDARYLDFLKYFKTIILGGETFSKDLYYKLSDLTQAEIFNNYGPAETTVWSTIKKITNEPFNVGRPISNTQIYILDKKESVLPVGLAGEICIAGDGVGNGYLNQPEITKERFVKNPFYNEQENHGKVMYHTGDLAKWNLNGEIEHLGRIDTQVKVRGLRIELGEIESAMSEIDGVLLAAVTDKKDEKGRQYLVGYYTSIEPINEKQMRQFLSSKLIKYMVPNYFLRLKQMPMTSGGKIDKKNLPMPDFTTDLVQYVEPETEQEVLLCSFMQSVLKCEKVGIEDDFFEMGGDSLSAIEFVTKANDAGIDISLQNIFDYPTVRLLDLFIREGDCNSVIEYEKCDFDKYEKILSKNKVDFGFIPKRKSLGNILLTGVTGFLGAHVLDVLVRNERGKIYCLIRGDSYSECEKKFEKTLEYYFNNAYIAEIENRVFLVKGDIEHENISKEMPGDVQTVIHTAASVKHYGNYEYFYRVNTLGTQHIVNYAKVIRAKMIHVSTLSVSGNSLADDFSINNVQEEKNFYESSLYIGQPLHNVYVRSKFEAERIVLDAILEGLDAKIIRVGNLTNRERDYKFQSNYETNAFLKRMKAFLELGLFPEYLMKLYAEFSPVDQTAEGVVKIAEYADEQTIFHLNSNKTIPFEKMLKILKEIGIKIMLVDGDVFYHALKQSLKKENTEYIYKAFQNDLNEKGELAYDNKIHVMNDFTNWFMKQLNFEWNEIDYEYIYGYIEYFRDLGYLEA